ncbi:cytochrome c oxidase subunit 5A, mitochondrial-like [Uranotaenia lowii]|uniref:cytochrome c oxidase subunit 5A, mitochondrial-like n=1 Tax=Uranotaenia lowii TaxID=190385 RepID=UPI00247ACD15|nr:cytochrome c oxidase subunit 5A, mitochondrial-like [Uranotaenia lowii]
MFRLLPIANLLRGASKFPPVVRSGAVPGPGNIVGAIRQSHGCDEDPAEFDARYEAYFNRPDIDGWEIRKAMTDLLGMDLVPEPKIIVAALKACRRVNDYALTTRFLEAVKDRCGDQAGTLYPYLVGEITPTLCELGISLPEEMGYHKPELWMKTILETEPF